YHNSRSRKQPLSLICNVNPDTKTLVALCKHSTRRLQFFACIHFGTWQTRQDVPAPGFEATNRTRCVWVECDSRKRRTCARVGSNSMRELRTCGFTMRGGRR